MNIPKDGLKLGTTLYSLTTEFHAREYTFEQLVRKVAAENLGPGLEIVGFQSFRGFPNVSDEFADQFKALIDETGLTLSCLGINADVWINPEVPMSEEESVAYHKRQLDAAAKLGFPLVRYQFPAGANVIEKCVPHAEKLGVKMGLEIHAPHHTQHPDILAYREMYERVRSPLLGFIPDFGASARAVPPSYFDTQRANGVPDGLIALAEEYWHLDVGTPFERRDQYVQAARAKGYEERHIIGLEIIFGLFSRADPRSWSEIMPQVIHIHGKFFDFDESGDEIAVDLAKVLPVFVEGGYNGFMSSEYEGYMWTDADGFDKIRRHHQLARRVLAPLQG
ncbi:sugar phosphate isomerase/epimerase [Telluria mixta]|uniref:Sugar phosphate isomerase/epimerase n=1 Tax=Telluria mixta TaxID=34071 RepID=A0ABT2C1G2_9BURK|nr:sugar phosphate isomerase/epimerase [Telluria mixta]MCS0631209.1 sugar phosphate isomerase/epimerase [Telluria mixta]WEM95748.1 sugar phosphate isomerase/epimerase [Telluria mixta]